jgi:DNA-binding Xre family transcriptional regulator
MIEGIGELGVLKSPSTVNDAREIKMGKSSADMPPTASENGATESTIVDGGTTSGENVRMDVIDTLRRAIKQADVSQYKICQDTGIDKATLSRFVRGERGLSLENIDAVCRRLGLTLKAEKRKTR